MKPTAGRRWTRAGGGAWIALWALGACTRPPGGSVDELVMRDCVLRYRAGQEERLAARPPACAAERGASPTNGAPPPGRSTPARGEVAAPATPDRPLLLGTLAWPDQAPGETRPAAAAPDAAETAVVPEGYWRADIWHQMGHEALELGSHGFWKGFKTSFWDFENALVLTATMGASIAIRETGVDDAIRRRTDHNQELGCFDEPIQILGNPGTHFAAAGVLWLSSALTHNAREHEVAKTLGQALAVNGVSTLLLKVAANTRAPDNEPYAWPSGHTSSAFTAAAVLNEYYGPWVGVPSLALAGLVGYQRIDSRVHDFSDVVFGAMLGYIVGRSIARDNRAEFPEIFGMKLIPYADPETGTSGLALLKQW